MKSILGVGGSKSLACFFLLICWSSQGVTQGAYDSADSSQHQKTELRLLRVTPHGDDVPVRNRQLVFKFNQPVTVTNLKQLQVNNYSRTTSDSKQAGLGYLRALADVEDIAYKVPLGVRDMLAGKSGLIVGHIGRQFQVVA